MLVCFSIASFFLPKELYDLGHDKLGNVMPPALDAMDEESAMPPDGAIPPAVDPSLNETSSTKLRNTELRGSTVPELPTINLSPDPSAVAATYRVLRRCFDADAAHAHAFELAVNTRLARRVYADSS